MSLVLQCPCDFLGLGGSHGCSSILLKSTQTFWAKKTTGNFYKDSWMGGFSSWQDQKKWRQNCQKKLKAATESAVDAKRLRTTCFPSKHCPGKWINTRGAQLTEFSLRKLNSLGWICIVVSEQLWLLVSSAQSPGWQALAITTEVTWAKQIHKYVVNEL